MLTECLPVKVKAIHACTGSGKAAFELVNPVLKHMVGRVIRLQRIMHVSCCARGSRIRYISPEVFVLIVLRIYHRWARTPRSCVSWNHLVLVRFISNPSLAKYCSECRVMRNGSSSGVKLNAIGRANAKTRNS
jgi:hypothetical protein